MEDSETDCEFSVTPKLLPRVKVYANHSIPERCAHRKTLHSIAESETGARMMAAFCARALLVQ
jgi:hypothetical protein